MWKRAFVAIGVVAITLSAQAQTCTTAAKMLPATQSGILVTAMNLSDAIKAGDTAFVQAHSVSELALSFGTTAYLARTVGETISADTLTVTQAYQLDANAHQRGDNSVVSFACVLSGTAAETDFEIDGLPAGLYAFAMVEATGTRPWLLSFLLKQEAGLWKMAGFYPHARSAAGHDGVWFWQQARTSEKAKQPWLSWVQFGEADTLLRPANFASSTNLDRLRTERNAVAGEIPELRDGLSATTPLVIKDADGRAFAFTSISAEGSEDGKRLNLHLHFKADTTAKADAGTDPAAMKARNFAAAKALLAAHPELKSGFDGIWVFAENNSEGSVQAPFVSQFVPNEL